MNYSLFKQSVEKLWLAMYLFFMSGFWRRAGRKIFSYADMYSQ